MSKIATARKLAGLSQQALAKALGVSQGSVAHWENGRRQPSVRMLKRIADALGVSAGDLIE